MKEKEVFDFVIVGAGSAGCVLANRLTENKKISVLLIEAGLPDKRQEIHIPAAFSKLFKTDYDWAYYTEQQPHLNNRSLYWPRGRVLGGCSSINAMIYTRGNTQDYDEWEQLGNQGWGWSNVERLFTKAENQQRDSLRQTSSGLLDVSDLRTVNPLSQAFVEACKENGIAYNDNFNGRSQEGAGFFQVTQRNGERCSTAKGYLKPALSRPNLKVLTQAYTTRILFEGKQAIGVEYVQNGNTNQVKVSKEVIVSGGAINSPHLLMLSGIGSGEQLSSLGITVVADLPGVGKNLQDHLMLALTYESKKAVSLAGAETFANLINYLLFKKGMLTSNIGEAGAFIKSEKSLSVPDIELIFGPTYYMSHGFLNPKGHGFTVGSILLHPKSSGYIALRSSDPFQPPVINPNYFSASEDIKFFVKTVELCRHIAQAKAFDSFKGKEVWPGSQIRSEAEVVEFVKNSVETLYHPVGTCKMGKDPLAVVDNEAKVHGIGSLRVVDASIMPTIITGHTNAVAIMIAEKVAELIQK